MRRPFAGPATGSPNLARARAVTFSIGLATLSSSRGEIFARKGARQPAPLRLTEGPSHSRVRGAHARPEIAIADHHHHRRSARTPRPPAHDDAGPSRSAIQAAPARSGEPSRARPPRRAPGQTHPERRRGAGRAIQARERISARGAGRLPAPARTMGREAVQPARQPRMGRYASGCFLLRMAGVDTRLVERRLPGQPALLRDHGSTERYARPAPLTEEDARRPIRSHAVAPGPAVHRRHAGEAVAREDGDRGPLPRPEPAGLPPALVGDRLRGCCA